MPLDECECRYKFRGDDSDKQHRGRCKIHQRAEREAHASEQEALRELVESRKRQRAQDLPSQTPASSSRPAKRQRIMPWLSAPASKAAPKPAESVTHHIPPRVALPPHAEHLMNPPDSPPRAGNDDISLPASSPLDVENRDIISEPEPDDDDIRPGPYNLRRRPRILLDILPDQLEPVEPEVIEPEPAPAVALPAGLTGPAPRNIATRPNRFGLWKEYLYPPSIDPQDLADSVDCLAPKLRAPSTLPQSSNRIATLVTCKSHKLLLQWHTSGSGKKSLQDTTRLVEDVLRDPEFDPADFQDNSWKRTFSALGESIEGDDDGWTTESITIDVPILKRFRHLHNGAHSMGYILHGFQHRRLCPLIRYILEHEESSAAWTFDPYKLFVTREDGRVERVYGEVFSSDAMLEEHAQVQQKLIPEDKGGALPRCIIALMFGSDATHLAQFGTSSIWPGYMMFGNQSKYVRACPSANAVHQICYFERLPDAAQTFIRTHTGGKAAKNALLTFCKREAMHESWKVLLDDEFIHAYEWGMVIDCMDGVRRLCFPRVIAYTADYPEKVIIATIKDKGDCLCPRCQITKTQVPKVGQKLDMLRRTTQAREDDATRQWKVAAARRAIYDRGIAVNSAALDHLLKGNSLTPNINAFSDRLGPFGFDFHRMLLSDVLHQFEKGNFEAMFIHMLRVFQAFDSEHLGKIDDRFRAMATFGRSTIRKFHNNVSELKKLAARDFEDILQCAIPAIEGILPEPLDKLFQDLLFVAADFHASIKLRMHTDSSLIVHDTCTTDFGSLLRKFKSETDAVETKELPREIRARQRRAATQTTAPVAPSKPQIRKFNLETFKIHSIGDYGHDIRQVGTTDSYDSRLIEHTHPKLKRANAATNHHSQNAQIAASDLRAARLRRLKGATGTVSAAEKNLPHSAPESHYHVGKGGKAPVNLSHFTANDERDPATKNFFLQLKSHLLERMGVLPDLPDERYSESARSSIVITNGKLYLHRVMRLNYTTYDLRRDQDSINPRTSHRDVMFLSQDDRRNAHPYWYARVLNIFHVFVTRTNTSGDLPQRFDCLWIRWFGEDPEWHDGWAKRRLPRIGFVPDTDPDAFGFLDPATVIRACHLLPTYSEGRTSVLMPYAKSMARRKDEIDDWTNYYVGIFVDRDMRSRYRGGGIGHRFSLPTRTNAWFPLAQRRRNTAAERRRAEQALDETEHPEEPEAPGEPQRVPLEGDALSLQENNYEFDDSASEDDPDEESAEADDIDDADAPLEPEDDEEGAYVPGDSDDELGYDLDDMDATLDDEL